MQYKKRARAFICDAFIFAIPSLEKITIIRYNFVSYETVRIINKRGVPMNIDYEEVVKDVEAAMERKELKAYYQPQYNALTNKIVSAEALVRWVKPDGTLVPPAAFIPVMERNEKVNQIDWYMLREVCAMLKTRIDAGKKAVPVSVNFSRWHIKETDYIERLCEIVDSYGISHDLIEVEITESALVNEADAIGKWIDELRARGFSIALDDFGSGLSSLQFVKDMAIDVLKIDKSLLSHNCVDDKERVVLESIFYFANRLKLTTVAEGVETEAQLGFLRTCDCKKIQGFIYSKPLPEEEFQKKLDEKIPEDMMEDILSVQAPRGAMNLLMDAIFQKYPLVIFSNLTRNSFYMMAYDNFSSTSCPASGTFDDLIAHGASTMHPEDQELFATTFSRENLLKAYGERKNVVKTITRQIGDDGIYRRVETMDFFVKSPAVDDILVISLCDNLEE
jgi:EAL domain-containing protein (putative c-di-GMP-specific phosphodiesterase class I)